jgi:hypothetical protein
MRKALYAERVVGNGRHPPALDDLIPRFGNQQAVS